MNPEFPTQIIYKDEDGGFTVCKLVFIDQLEDKPAIPVYEFVNYYHSLESAIKEEF